MLSVVDSSLKVAAELSDSLTTLSIIVRESDSSAASPSDKSTTDSTTDFQIYHGKESKISQASHRINT